MPKRFQGPFYSYLDRHLPAEVGQVLRNLDTFIGENGPFDRILGFSHGGAIAATYILDHQMRNPLLPPHFSFAVFISAAGPFSPDPSFLQDKIKRLIDQSSPNSDGSFPFFDFNYIDPVSRVFVEYLALYSLAYKDLGIKKPVINLDFFHIRDSNAVPRVLHPAFVKDRIGIPTVHTTGQRDLTRLLQLSLAVQGLCEGSMMRTLHHQGGHTLPMAERELQDLAFYVDWAANHGRFRSQI